MYIINKENSKMTAMLILIKESHKGFIDFRDHSQQRKENDQD